MGRPEIQIPDHPFVYGAELEPLCRDCPLPCSFQVMGVDCSRRFFGQGLVECAYLIRGYCFLEEKPGCVFDNGGEHDVYWLKILRRYFHGLDEGHEEEMDFEVRAQQVRDLIDHRIETGTMPLCRYFEEYYNRVVEMGCGVGEETLAALDAAYEAYLRGADRKR